MEDSTDKIIDVEKVNNAIKSTLSLFEDENLNVAEGIQVVMSIESGFKVKYGDVYELLDGIKRNG